MNLFKKCLADPNRTAPSEISSSFMKGSMLIIKSVCNNHHESVRKSQPLIGNSAVGNILLAAATLFSGNVYTTLNEICQTAKLQIFSKCDCYRMQRLYLLPSINHMWTIEQSQVLESK